MRINTHILVRILCIAYIVQAPKSYLYQDAKKKNDKELGKTVGIKPLAPV
jgi:hypothetical protein